MISLHRPRTHASVFGKLVAIMLTMAASLLILVGAFFWTIITPSLNGTMWRVTQEYVRVLGATSLDYMTAKQLGARLDLEVRYAGPNVGWTTSDELPSIADVRTGRIRGALVGGAKYYLVPAPSGGTYLFASTFTQRMHTAHLSLMIMLFVLMVGVVVMAHAVLRHLLRPLRVLNDGVARFSEGQLDVVLPNRTRDEFGTLTDAFNRMVGRVSGMIRARDQLLLDVSHELRSPVTRLKVALELLPHSDMRTRMAGDLTEMEAMITELLELERLRDGRGIRPSRQDVMPVLRKIIQQFRDRPPGVQITSTEAQTVLDVDADKLVVVIRNLVENAIKYSLPDSRPVEVSVARDGASLIIRVTDDGPGIPPADIGNLFEPFFRVDRSRSRKTGGYGLGLSICKRIMEAQGGEITAQNNLTEQGLSGRGACFVLKLPCPEDSPQEGENALLLSER